MKRLLLAVLILAVAGSALAATPKKKTEYQPPNLEVGLANGNIEVGSEGKLPCFQVRHVVDDTHVIATYNLSFYLTFPAKAVGLVDGKLWQAPINCKATGTIKYGASTMYTLEPKALDPPDPKAKKKTTYRPTKKEAEEQALYRKTTALVLEILEKLPHAKK